MTGAHHDLRVVSGNHANGVGTVQLGQRLLGGTQQVVVMDVVGVNQMHHHFGVGVRFKRVALRRQTLAQRLVVFDDAVVYQREQAIGKMRVGIALARGTVGGPAGVTNADQAFEADAAGLFSQFGHALG